MPTIDIDKLKYGLSKVGPYVRELDKANEILKAGPADHAAAVAAVDEARKRYHEACIGLYGYIQGTVIQAEREAQAASETSRERNPSKPKK